MHTISIYVENRSGALSRIAGLFSSRGYNISSLTVAETEEPNVSRMTLVVNGDNSIIEQVVKQLNRLIDVIKVREFRNHEIIERELAVIRINATKSQRPEIIQVAAIYEGKIVEVTPSSLTVEMADSPDKVRDFITLIKPYGIKELIRTGKIAMAKSAVKNNNGNNKM